MNVLLNQFNRLWSKAPFFEHLKKKKHYITFKTRSKNTESVSV